MVDVFVRVERGGKAQFETPTLHVAEQWCRDHWVVDTALFYIVWVYRCKECKNESVKNNKPVIPGS